MIKKLKWEIKQNINKSIQKKRIICEKGDG